MKTFREACAALGFRIPSPGELVKNTRLDEVRAALAIVDAYNDAITRATPPWEPLEPKVPRPTTQTEDVIHE